MGTIRRASRLAGDGAGVVRTIGRGLVVLASDACPAGNGTMRIAVLADTHDRFPSGLPGKLRGADGIWHLGDVCNPTTLVEFEQLGIPLRVVRGNNDWHAPWPLSLSFKCEGFACHLVHIPPLRAPRGCQLLLHGHMHVPRDEVDANGVRWLNPGCVSYANRGAPPSFAWLELAEGKIKWRVVRL